MAITARATKIRTSGKGKIIVRRGQIAAFLLRISSKKLQAKISR